METESQPLMINKMSYRDYYANQLAYCMEKGTWAVNGFVENMSRQSGETRKQMVDGIFQYIRSKAFSKECCETFWGNHYAILFEFPDVHSHMTFLFQPTEVTDLLDYASRNYHERDSQQLSFCFIVQGLISAGYVLSSVTMEQVVHQLQELSRKIRTYPSVPYKNAFIRYSYLLCCYRIQATNCTPEEKNHFLSLLHKQWRVITRIISVYSGFVIGCELANFVSLTANMKSYLELAHLYVHAAHSEKGRRNRYCGKSGIDQLQKLEYELQHKPYTRNSELDELYLILFPQRNSNVIHK